MCCHSWGRKESDTTERLNRTELMDVIRVASLCVKSSGAQHNPAALDPGLWSPRPIIPLAHRPPGLWSPTPIVPPGLWAHQPVVPRPIVPPAHDPPGPWSPRPWSLPGPSPRWASTAALDSQNPFPSRSAQGASSLTCVQQMCAGKWDCSACKPFLQAGAAAPALQALLGPSASRPWRRLGVLDPRAQPEAPPWSPCELEAVSGLTCLPRGPRKEHCSQAPGLRQGPVARGRCLLPESCTPGAPKGKLRQEAVGPFGPSGAPFLLLLPLGPLCLPSPGGQSSGLLCLGGPVPGVRETLEPHKERVGEPALHPSGSCARRGGEGAGPLCLWGCPPGGAVSSAAWPAEGAHVLLQARGWALGTHGQQGARAHPGHLLLDGSQLTFDWVLVTAPSRIRGPCSRLSAEPGGSGVPQASRPPPWNCVVSWQWLQVPGLGLSAAAPARVETGLPSHSVAPSSSQAGPSQKAGLLQDKQPPSAFRPPCVSGLLSLSLPRNRHLLVFSLFL